MSEGPVEAAVLGASGYVGGELLRLLAGHPRLRLRAASSSSRSGLLVEEVFPHLRGALEPLCFTAPEEIGGLLSAPGPLALFSALPHGEAAAPLDRLLQRAQVAKKRLLVVDLSADFRLADPEQYEQVYGLPHPAPERLASFTCGLPELEPRLPKGPVAHPGCFTTAVTLACHPFQVLGLAEPRYLVSAVTGSTGSGRDPSPTTHHPERHGNLVAYQPLRHRHEIEMRALLCRPGEPLPEICFVPHSGPFARGIHATIHLRLLRPASTAEVLRSLEDYYASSPFVSVGAEPPRLKEVVGTNRCRLGVAVRGRDAVVFSVIDNLTKGAAGGAIQWMNRLLGWDETLGLRLPGLGWN